jgi:hypothetical protein
MLRKKTWKKEFERAAAFTTMFAAAALLSAPLHLSGANAPTELRIDFSQTNGFIRSLHGINKGPLAPGGLIDVTADLRVL